MRKDENVAWHQRVREAAQARELRVKQLHEAMESQASGTPGGSSGSVSMEADQWAAQGARAMAKHMPKHDHIVLIAATHADTVKTGVGSVINCDSMTAMLALGRLVAEVNNALRANHVDMQVELRLRPIRRNDGEADA